MAGTSSEHRAGGIESPPVQDFEKLGAFYLGRLYNLERKAREEALLLYDSKDLVTHGLCVGMTGSGKTGLCIGILEEAALDGIPAIAIDPKGDLGNLLLTFPELRAEDFRPWINEQDASRKGQSPDAYAAAQAELWREGLAEWGQDGERIRRLRESVDLALYTPGSTAGLPLSILASFAAPPAALRQDGELLAERIGTTATSLLGLLGIEADPLQSREHILVSTILGEAWEAGRDLDLTRLIHAIQEPPVERVGVLDVETFYPAKERFQLALKLNNLIASPGFASWLSGEPLDVGRLLYTAEGKPRISILAISHLSEAERMFFVSLLLNEVVGWMRGQPGTTSLRALVYMDEIFGFFPPVANPPSKTPLLTLLKQARAHGLGVLLATQNPVDLDYKGLSNAGTWFLGRLQTERDKGRVLEGLEGVAAGSGGAFDRAGMEETLAGLGKRIFLMHDVHRPEPAIFESRWAMSYLRGPLTRSEIKRLTGDRLPEADAPAEPAARVEPAATGPQAGDRPVLPPDIREFFVPFRGTRPTGSGLHYAPVLLGSAEFRCDDRKAGVDVSREIMALFPMTPGPVPIDWDAAGIAGSTDLDLSDAPVEGAVYGDPPTAALDEKSYTKWRRQFADWVYRTQVVRILRSPVLEEASRPEESERDFRIRLQQLARERRDESGAALRKKYESRIARLEEKSRRAQQAVEREREQARTQKVQTAISFGATILGSVFGRSSLGRGTTAARGVGRSIEQAGDVHRAAESLAAAQEELRVLDAEFRAELDALKERIDPLTEPLEEIEIRPEKNDVSVRLVSFAWAPHWDDGAGRRTPAWQRVASPPWRP